MKTLEKIGSILDNGKSPRQMKMRKLAIKNGLVLAPLNIQMEPCIKDRHKMVNSKDLEG